MGMWVVCGWVVGGRGRAVCGCAVAFVCMCFALILTAFSTFLVRHHPPPVTLTQPLASILTATPSQARRNKYIMQEEIRKKGVRAVTQRLATSEADVRAFCGELRALCKVSGCGWWSGVG